MEDTVAIDAKRILLRYGAPITVLDQVSDSDRIKFARSVARTPLPEREKALRGMLVDSGYLEEPQ